MVHLLATHPLQAGRPSLGASSQPQVHKGLPSIHGEPARPAPGAAVCNVCVQDPVPELEEHDSPARPGHGPTAPEPLVLAKHKMETPQREVSLSTHLRPVKAHAESGPAVRPDQYPSSVPVAPAALVAFSEPHPRFVADGQLLPQPLAPVAGLFPSSGLCSRKTLITMTQLFKRNKI